MSECSVLVHRVVFAQKQVKRKTKYGIQYDDSRALFWFTAVEGLFTVWRIIHE